MIQPTTNIPASLWDKIADYIQASSRKVDNICRRNGISKETADALVQDITAVMQARYSGFTSTPDNIKELTDKTTRKTWDRTENPALCIVAATYFEIAKTIAGQQRIIGTEWARPIEACEQAKIRGEEPTQEMLDNAQWFAYLYCVMIAAERCNATKEELLQIEPYNGTTDRVARKRQEVVVHALDMQRQHAAVMARKEEKKAAAQVVVLHGEDNAILPTPQLLPKPTTPAFVDDTKTIKAYQNFAYMMGKDIYTTTTTANDGAAARPLWDAIEEQKRAVEALKTDRRLHATPQDIEREENRITTTAAITTAMRGIWVLPQNMLPISGDTMQSTYRTTPRQFAIHATGQEHPNEIQIANCMRALDFLSTQRMEIYEDVIKRVPTYDANGNVVKDGKGRAVKTNKVVKTITRFNPCTTTFYGEFNEETQAVQAKEIVLSISNIILDGKSGQHKHIIEEDGKPHQYAIATPQVHRLPLWQVYEFTSDEEQRFQFAILSKGKRNEEDLLNEVFAYNEKKAKAEAAVEDAKRQLQNLTTSTTATEEEIQAAQRDYLNAKERATDCTTKHKGRDKDRLQAMFQKAQDIGLLKYWYKEPQANKTGKKTAYNYIWGRFTDEEIKKHKRKKS